MLYDDPHRLRVADHVVGLIALGPKTGGDIVRGCVPDYTPSEVADALKRLIKNKMVVLASDMTYRLYKRTMPR